MSGEQSATTAIQDEDAIKCKRGVARTRKADICRSISIVEENDTDPEDKASQRKLQRARVSPYRRRATPITIISVGVNETTIGEGMEYTRGRGGNANTSPKAHVCRKLEGLIGVD
ncbi:hypothetical protein G5I_09211 [Acromyrmex echinatior]|uniref:Uncharacterized protein n=1 Tax=Acromyrmex echinatior TaxID=103372 RepID=F4WTK6_ACREC|nr:hypothetical protein G5I_09211 [Acromyrmex echinatior]